MPIFSDLSPLWISLRAAVLATGLAFLVGVMMARWMMTYRGKGRYLVDGVLTLPLVLPPTVVGFVLLLLLGRNSPIGQFLRHIGLNVIFTWYATVIAATVVAFPLMYKTALGAFEQIEPNLIHAARTLGASEWRIFWQVLLPLAWPGLMAGTILTFARALGEFGATLMVAGSIPGVTQTIPTAIFFAAEAGEMSQALGWVLLMVAVSLGVIGLMHYWSDGRGRQWAAGAAGTGTFKPNRSPARSRAVQPRPSRSRPSSARPSSLDISTSGQQVWPEPHLPTRRYSLRQQLLNVLLLGQRYPVLAVAPENESADSSVVKSPLDGPRPPQSHPRSLVVNIRKRLHGFHLEAAFSSEGSPLGILGSSGSGKSMTLRCIAGLETPTEGQIILNDRILFDSLRGINIPSHQRRIGVVFQNYALFPHLNVVQNIAFGLQDMPRTERSHRIHYYLHLLHLSGLAHRYPHELSGGQQQRVALARALAIAPDAILLDEPLSALDTHLRSQLEKLLTEVLSAFDGISLFVTHNLEEVYRVCPRIMVMDEGQAIAAGPKHQIFERPRHSRVARITGCKNFSTAVVRGANLIEAKDWRCVLETLETVPDTLTQVGIRAHQITFMDVPRLYATDDEDPEHPNIFPCWVAEKSETPHRMTLYLKLHSPPSSPNDYHLQAEIFKEKWIALKSKPLPWHVQLDPVRLILLTE